jgi:hypothetical protein
MRRIIAVGAAFMLLLAGLVTVGPAAAVASPVSVEVAKVGRLTDGDRTVTFRATARCEPGLEVLEAFVTVSQDSFVQVGLPLTCDGRQQVFTLAATVIDGSFQPGVAQASAFVLVLDPATGQTAQAQDSEQMRLR